MKLCAPMKIARAILPHRQHHMRVREGLPKSGNKRVFIIRSFADKLRGLNFIYKEVIDALQRPCLDFLCHRRRIQNDLHPPFMCLLNQVRNAADLILKHQIIPR